MNHVMLDIQTLGLKPGCVVLSVALVRFSDLASLSITLDRASQVQVGLREDPQTVAWWQGQSATARSAAFDNAHHVLEYIAQWQQWSGFEFIWCHGAGFDAPILTEVFERFGLPCPWKYFQVRDTRTLFDLAGINLADFYEGERHIALNDAMAQTKAAKRALEILAPRYAETAI